MKNVSSILFYLYQSVYCLNIIITFNIVFFLSIIFTNARLSLDICVYFSAFLNYSYRFMPSQFRKKSKYLTSNDIITVLHRIIRTQMTNQVLFIESLDNYIVVQLFRYMCNINVIYGHFIHSDNLKLYSHNVSTCFWLLVK